MGILQMLKLKSVKAPEEPPTLEQLEARLARVREHIEFCRTEINVGSRYTSMYAEQALPGHYAEEQDLAAAIARLKVAETQW